MFIYSLISTIYDECSSAEQRERFISFLDKYPSFMFFLPVQFSIAQERVEAALAAGILQQSDVDLILANLNKAQGK